MNIRPVSDRIVIEPTQSDEKSPGGIFIPPTAKEKSFQGKVVSTGPGRTTTSGILIPTQVKVGDSVVYEKEYGIEFEIDRKKYTIIPETAVIAILD